MKGNYVLWRTDHSPEWLWGLKSASSASAEGCGETWRGGEGERWILIHRNIKRAGPQSSESKPSKVLDCGRRKEICSAHPVHREALAPRLTLCVNVVIWAHRCLSSISRCFQFSFTQLSQTLNAPGGFGAAWPPRECNAFEQRLAENMDEKAWWF